LSWSKLEEFLKTLEKCPSCGSSEGFWLTPTLEKRLIQCKHCGALIEVCEALESKDAKTGSKFKILLRER